LTNKGGISYERKNDGLDLEALERQIRGMQSGKRQFLGI